MKHHDARDQALGALYGADVLRYEDVDTARISKRAAGLAMGTWEHREAIDVELAAASTRWRIERMPAVDRNIMRLAIYELRYTDLPVAVVISEAVELAKCYSTANSGKFVNGVLSAVADSESASPEM